MPRYFLNVWHGTRPLIRDGEGDEAADVAAIRAHALGVARDLVLRTRLDTVRDWFTCAFEITNEAGVLVCTVAFAEAFPEAQDAEGLA